jgi:hypothetical protein
MAVTISTMQQEAINMLQFDVPLNLRLSFQKTTVVSLIRKGLIEEIDRTDPRCLYRLTELGRSHVKAPIAKAENRRCSDCGCGPGLCNCDE